MSSSIRDGGVRIKTMALDNDIWHLFPVTVDKCYCEEWMRRHDNCCYSKQGLIRTKIGWWPDFSDAYFCTEVVAELLGLDKSATYGPKKIFQYLTRNGIHLLTPNQITKEPF